MNKDLYKTLIEHNLLNDNTQIKADIPVKIFGNHTVVKPVDTYWGPNIFPEQILEIEGMSPKRFAQAYNIKFDGTKLSYKKRGRKSKKDINNS